MTLCFPRELSQDRVGRRVSSKVSSAIKTSSHVRANSSLVGLATRDPARERFREVGQVGRGEEGVRGRGLSFLDFSGEPRGHGRLATGIYPLSLLRPHQTDSEGIKV